MVFRFSKKGLLRLFLIISFPINLWAIIFWLRDLEWVSQRTDFWDGIGLGAYALSFAFIEALALLVLLVGLSFLLPRRWHEETVIVILGTLFFVFSLWEAAIKLSWLVEYENASIYARTLLATGHPVRYLVIASVVMLALVLVSVAFPVTLMPRNQKLLSGMNTFFERIVVLSWLYLGLNLFSLVIVFIRNV
jgi:hypothetical protein